MAALTSSGVTFNDIWYSADTGRTLKCADVTLVLSSQGGTTNNIPCTLFGMSRLREASIATDSVGSLVFLAAPSYDRTKLYIYNTEVSTDADRADPVDISATIRLVVKGVE